MVTTLSKRFSFLRIIAFVAVILLEACSSPNDCDRAFNKLLWFQNPDFRHLLVNSLIESRTLDTLDGEAVTNLLGKPHSANSNYTAYYLGRPKGKFRAGDPIYFVMEFDAQERVSNYYINTEPIKKISRSLTIDKK